jgi:CubicO group peptidase (beta-lactamase class C family)
VKTLPAVLVAVAVVAAVTAAGAASGVRVSQSGAAEQAPPAPVVAATAAASPQPISGAASPARSIFSVPAAAEVAAASVSTTASSPVATPPSSASPAPVSSPAPSSSPSSAPSPASAVSPAPTESADPLAAAERRAEAAASVEAVLPEFYDRAQELFARSGVPGAALAVVAGDRAVYVDCFGVREAGRPERVDPHTVFQLASVSKGFTATMLAALVTRRELGWDDPVRASWPGFALWDPWVSGHVTVRDLMSMRSGLPEYAGDELQAFGYGRAEILHRLRYLEPVAGFRAAYAYQNALPTAAAMTASRASGRSWTGLVQDLVLDPLGMRSTVLSYRAYLDAPDRSASHTLVDGVMKAQTPQDDDVFAPAGAVSSTIIDLVPYLRMQLNGGALAGERVTSAEALAATHAATTVAGDKEDGPVAYAMGWKTYGYQGRRVVEHGGDFSEGVSTLVSMVPGDGVGIVVLTNAFPEGHALAAALERTLYDLYMTGEVREDWLAEQQAAIAAATQGVLEPYRRLPEERPADAAPPRARAAYTGTYANAYYGQVRVSAAPGAGLTVKLGRGDVLRYVPWDGDTWREPSSDTAAVFTVRGGRAVAVKLLLLDYDGRDGRFARR